MAGPPKPVNLKGEQTCEVRAKAAALPPMHELRSQGLKMEKNIKNNNLRSMGMKVYGK